MTGVVKYNKCRQVVERLQRGTSNCTNQTTCTVLCASNDAYTRAYCKPLRRRRHNTLSHDLYFTCKFTFLNYCIYITLHFIYAFTNQLPIFRPNDRVKLIVVNVSRNVHQANEVLVTVYLYFLLAYLELRCIRLLYVTESGVYHK